MEGDIGAFLNRVAKVDEDGYNRLLSEGYADWLRTYTGLEERRKALDNRRLFEHAVETAVVIAPVSARRAKVSIDKFVEPKSDGPLGGVYHDSGNKMAVASDLTVLVMSSKDYDADKAGKIVSPKGSILEGVEYPAVARVIPGDDLRVSNYGVDFGVLEGMVSKAMSMAKSERNRRIARGEKTVNGNKITYDYDAGDGVRLRVTTEKHGVHERFTNFMSNRGPRQEKRAENTQSSAPRSNAEVSGAKVGKKSVTDKAKELRTTSGVVYGWTVDGEVWLNRDAMNPETPLHEYTHLWDAMVRRENPELWERGKELMKQTPLWEEVMDDPNYADIRDNEDEVASEVHSRLTGRRGAERMAAMVDEVRSEGPVAEAARVTLVERLKRWLHDMFGALKETLGKWSRRDLRGLTAEQFADMTLRDLAEGVNPRSGDRTLVAVHNISEDKLGESLELGGLPMPSMAVTKAATGHSGYGDISLVFGRESIDPSDRRNKVYSGDAWTPTFPEIGYKLDDKLTGKIYARANKAGHLPMFLSVDFHPDNIERRLGRGGEQGLMESLGKDYGVKQMFLSEQGYAVKEFAKREVEKYTPDNIGMYDKMLERIGVDRLRNESYESLLPEVKEIIGQQRGEDFDKMPSFVAKTLIRGSIRNAVDYADNGNVKTETDLAATRAKIDGRIDPEKYESWLEDTFSGIIEKRGIRGIGTHRRETAANGSRFMMR